MISDENTVQVPKAPHSHGLFFSFLSIWAELRKFMKLALLDFGIVWPFWEIHLFYFPAVWWEDVTFGFESNIQLFIQLLSKKCFFPPKMSKYVFEGSATPNHKNTVFSFTHSVVDIFLFIKIKSIHAYNPYIKMLIFQMSARAML